MEIKMISGQVCSVGETEIEILIDGFRGTRTLPIDSDTPEGFRRDGAVFAASVLAPALRYDARGLAWKDLISIEFDGVTVQS